ncbi:hypothetical protein KK062_15190 [Fulvivirgaceae bacterium PWU5]|uniref:Capsule polysaccharide biosynthesis protein n=1 Tax=Dawidia cretensis TaxID=2782350 RepID=A0AAP2GQE2_9BACT|nr:hypothetical protein [Dawidia cretensis]MBT1709586.1 hypothetical protein [Dawidia cretensis]
MRTLVFSPYLSSLFNAVMLDRLQEEIHAGAEKLYFLSCFQTFDICAFNKTSESSNCYYCEANIVNSLKLVEGDYEVLRLAQLIAPEDRVMADDFFSNVTDIRHDLYFETFDVGEAAISPYITRTRDKNLVRENKDGFLRQVSYNSLLVYLGVKRFLQEHQIEKVIFFNGRLDYTRSVLRACQALSVDCYLYERVRPGGIIECFHNVLPHTIEARQALIDEAWNDPAVPQEEKMRIGSNYYERKRKGEVIIARSFVVAQEKNRLPAGIDFSRKNVVLYNSSDDEIAAVGPMYKNPFFEGQEDGTQYVVDFYGKNFPEYNLIIRMHPNLKGLTYHYVEVIRSLHQKYPNVYVIAPESEVDTYALLDTAWKVISFGTSMGLEASFWGKPVVLLAKARYFYADVAYVPADRAGVDALLTDDLAPKDKANPVKFGYYYLNGGTKARYFFSKGLNQNYFKGQPMKKFTLKQKLINRAIKVYTRLTKKKVVIRTF